MGRGRSRGKHAPRESWGEYGISKRKRRYLASLVRSRRFGPIAVQSAYEAGGTIAGHILLSVIQRKSFEDVEYADGLGRIPCGRTDFYGYRRKFYHIFSKKIREGKVMDSEKAIRIITEALDAVYDVWDDADGLRECDAAVEFITNALGSGKAVGRLELDGKQYAIYEVR